MRPCQENMWEFAGEGIRKYDLIRWNLLVEKINEFKQTYLNELADGTYQKTIYFNYLDEKKTKIDFSSVTWYGIPDGKTAADYDGSIDSFGAAKLDSGSDTQVDVNLPSISSGLVGDNVALKNLSHANRFYNHLCNQRYDSQLLWLCKLIHL